MRLRVSILKIQHLTLKLNNFQRQTANMILTWLLCITKILSMMAKLKIYKLRIYQQISKFSCSKTRMESSNNNYNNYNKKIKQPIKKSITLKRTTTKISNHSMIRKLQMLRDCMMRIWLMTRSWRSFRKSTKPTRSTLKLSKTRELKTWRSSVCKMVSMTRSWRNYRKLTKDMLITSRLWRIRELKTWNSSTSSTVSMMLSLRSYRKLIKATRNTLRLWKTREVRT